MKYNSTCACCIQYKNIPSRNTVSRYCCVPGVYTFIFFTAFHIKCTYFLLVHVYNTIQRIQYMEFNWKVSCTNRLCCIFFYLGFFFSIIIYLQLKSLFLLANKEMKYNKYILNLFQYCSFSTWFVTKAAFDFTVNT